MNNELYEVEMFTIQQNKWIIISEAKQKEMGYPILDWREREKREENLAGLLLPSFGKSRELELLRFTRNFLFSLLVAVSHFLWPAGRVWKWSGFCDRTVVHCLQEIVCEA